MKKKQSFQKEKIIFGRCVCVLKLTLHCRKVIRKSLFEWSHQKGEFYVRKKTSICKAITESSASTTPTIKLCRSSRNILVDMA